MEQLDHLASYTPAAAFVAMTVVLGLIVSAKSATEYTYASWKQQQYLVALGWGICLMAIAWFFALVVVMI